MDVLVITFELVDLNEATYRRQAEALAPVFPGVPGLLSKLWLADPARNTYGGVYVFRDRAAREAYLDSEIVRSMRANPHFGDLAIRAFGTIEAATAITGGPLAPELAGV